MCLTAVIHYLVLPNRKMAPVLRWGGSKQTRNEAKENVNIFYVGNTVPWV
jgi:hypothetical protein